MNDSLSTSSNTALRRSRWYMMFSLTLLAAPATNCDDDPNAQKLPCDVEKVLKERCQTCHSNPPTAGAPMPLVTYEDTQKTSPFYPDQKIWQRMHKRINESPTNPMPPLGHPLPDADKFALNMWFLSQAPPAPANQPTCTTGPDPECIGPQCLPCTPDKVIKAHHVSSTAHPEPTNFTDPYWVDPVANKYVCFNFTAAGLGIGDAMHATAWAPLVDNRATHHWILYGTNSGSYTHGSKTDNCYSVGSDATHIAGWSPGGNNTVLDPDVSANLKFTYYRLQVHYSSAGNANNRDASGVAFCTQPTARQNNAGIVRLGTMAISIPPLAQDHAVTATDCNNMSLDGKALTIIGTSPHMHLLGDGFRTQHLRGTTNLGDISYLPNETWNFENQKHYTLSPRRTYNAGDILRTTCVYDNPTSNTVFFGPNTEQEMCFDFIMVYPYASARKNCGGLQF